jgi:hypothetical protein
MAHVESDIYPFQIAPQSSHAMLFEVVWSRLAFWKSNGAILFSNAIFLNGPTTWEKNSFTFSKRSFRCHVNTFMFLCKSSHRGLIINLS